MSVVTANIWRGTAFTMLLLYAALHTVNRELYDAARVDGASRLRTLWHVTLPQIRPVLLVNVILITIATLNTFDMILSLTGGGPAQATEVLALRTYNSVFLGFNLAERLRVRRAAARREPAADRGLPPTAAAQEEPMSAHDRRRSRQRREADELDLRRACAVVLLFFGVPLLWILSLSLRTQAGHPRHLDQPDPRRRRRSTTTARCWLRAVPALPAQLG